MLMMTLIEIDLIHTGRADVLTIDDVFVLSILASTSAASPWLDNVYFF